MERKQLLVANWKMHKSKSAIHSFAKDFSIPPTNTQLGIAVPFPYISEAKALFPTLSIGAQACSSQHEGAFTGQVSAMMIEDCGASFVIIGHSERRKYQQEAEPLFAAQIDQALDAGLEVIYCLGETDESTDFKKIVEQQLVPIMNRDLSKISIAYEPVWAIGTGKPCSTERAEEAHRSIREVLKNYYSSQEADAVRIIYGGSVSPDNIKQYARKDQINGALVGGASLDPAKFAEIINYFEKERS